MTTQNVIVIVLVVIQVGLFALTAPKAAGSNLVNKQLRLFLLVAAGLATVRILVLFYIQSRVQSHTFSESVFYLTYLLYPELPVMVQLMPITSPALYFTTAITSLLLGSLLWAFPLLYFLSIRKNPGGDRQFH